MKFYFTLILLLFFMTSPSATAQTEKAKSNSLQIATLGGGCFWCTEAVFLQVKGVEKVVSGYMGGKVKNPTYKEVCSGLTGHAEVIQITFDPTVVSYEEVLEIFWKHLASNILL